MPGYRHLLHAGHHDNDEAFEPSDNDVTTPGCTSGDPWIWQNLHQCVDGPQQFLGFVMGMLVIAVWIAIHALLLRLRHEQYTSKKAWFSVLVLLHFTAPDCLSLLGAILAKQLSSQIILASYLVLADIAFWIYFALIKIYQNGGWCFQRCKSNKYNYYEKDRNMNNLVFVTPFVISFMYLASWFHWSKQWMPTGSSKIGTGLPMMTHRTRILMHADHGGPEIEIEVDFMREWLPKIGYGLGVAAILFTWSALLHQSQWVFQEKKVPKAHLVVNMLMILADVLYLISIFTQSVETGFLLHTLPWTMTRIGTIGLNIGILFQAYLNITQRLAGHEINKDVAMVLRSNEMKDMDETEEEGSDEDSPLLEVPKKNKYIRKMRRIARQMEKHERGQSSEDELFSDEENKKTEIPHSDIELELDLAHETLQYDLSNEEVYNILAAEDRQETTLPGHPTHAVLPIGSSDIDSNEENETVIYFHERTETPARAEDENSDTSKTGSKDYHQTVFLTDESLLNSPGYAVPEK